LGNYGWAIVVFTLLTKVILLPVSLWTQRNSIKMVEMMPELNLLKIKYYGDNEMIAEETQKLYKQKKYSPFTGIIPMFIQLIMLVGVIGAIRELLGGSDSIWAQIPYIIGGSAWFMPILAGLSALVLGLAQNRLNPLQKEQGRGEQIFTNGLSIGISLALGAFVPLGVGIYWICSNLFTIVQQLVLNVIIKPDKYIDYANLAKSRQELAEIDGLSAGVSAEGKRREKEDYKRFFKIANKHLVFYSEKSGFYKYFQGVIEELLKRSNVTIHYITSDPNDQIFQLAKNDPRLKPYYIGEKKLITLMMKMDADIVVMTMPDLDNFHIKRSYVRKDIEYIYMVHYGIGSSNLILRKLALAHFDTIFCAGPQQMAELRREEEVYKLPERNLVPCGYSLFDRIMAEYQGKPAVSKRKAQILIAPSWQHDNILDSCIDELLSSLLNGRYQVIVRPHPEYIKRYGDRLTDLQNRWRNNIGKDLIIQTDFSANNPVFESDLLITDWSTICYEFSFATKRPTLFIDTPIKAMNPDVALQKEYKKVANKIHIHRHKSFVFHLQL
jgi:YidC/Oxa1 family membrane protein insertase